MNLSKWDVSDIIAFASLILLGVSLSAPIFSAFIERKTRLKSKLIDVYTDTYSKQYNRQYDAFQDFIERSGEMIAALATEISPTPDKIQSFESACLKCLIFLDDKERQEFDNFRISVRLKLGYTDPRGEPSQLEKTFLNVVNAHTKAITSWGARTDVDSIYLAFNDCIKISSQKLANLDKEEQARLNSVLTTNIQHLHQQLKLIRKKAYSLLKSVKDRSLQLLQTIAKWLPPFKFFIK